MTEKEKMLSGKPYDTRDPELLNRYHEVRKLLKQYRETLSTDRKKKRQILRSLFGKVGEEVWVEAPLFCDYGEHITVGNNVFINYNCTFLDSNVISIGDNVLIGPGVHIYCATHPIRAEDRISTNPEKDKQSAYYQTESRPVDIAQNAWIGGGAQLMPGVTIGANTTIAAGSVVTESIPDNCLAAGNPCRVIRELG